MVIKFKMANNSTIDNTLKTIWAKLLVNMNPTRWFQVLVTLQWLCHSLCSVTARVWYSVTVYVTATMEIILPPYALRALSKPLLALPVMRAVLSLLFMPHIGLSLHRSHGPHLHHTSS